MSKRVHRGLDAVNCPVCITTAAKRAMPWHAGYIDTIARLPEIQRAHNVAMRRKERDQAMRDLGLTPVRGALGGRYWE